MNWHQLYTVATQAEREQITYLLLRAERRTSDRFAHSRSAVRYHFIGAPYKNKNARALYLGIFIFILATMTLGTWLVSLHIPPSYGAPLVFFWAIVPVAILCIQPVRRAHWI